jgi:hypothetical protein
VPIRTNRGRAAVYRRLWGWPMRSPRHLIVTLVLVFAVVTTIGIIVPRLTGSGTSGATADLSGSASATTSQRPGTGQGQPGALGGGAGQASGQVSGSPTTSLGTRITSPPQTPTSAKPAPEALQVIEAWAKAWVTHPQGISTEQWIDGLRQYTTDEQLGVMKSVNPANIPATAVTGPPVPKDSFGASVKATVPTNGGTLLITAISTPQGWKVAAYEPVS